MGQFSKRALKFISASISNFLDRGEIVTNRGTDVDSYEKSLKRVRKMTKGIRDNPEKYLDDDIDPAIIEQIERDALEWERNQK